MRSKYAFAFASLVITHFFLGVVGSVSYFTACFPHNHKQSLEYLFCQQIDKEGRQGFQGISAPSPRLSSPGYPTLYSCGFFSCLAGIRRYEWCPICCQNPEKSWDTSRSPVRVFWENALTCIYRFYCIRMKCLEFLYFYLMDESANPVDIGAQLDLLGVSDLPTAPNSPVKSNFRSATGGSSASSSSSSTSSSLSSGSSLASQSTSATSVSSASFSSSCFNGSSTPIEEQSPSKPLSAVPNLTPSSSRVVTPPQPRSLLMLRKEVDFVPLSPKKASAAKLGLGSPRVFSKQREGRSSEEMERESSSRISRSMIEQTPKRTTPQRLGLTQSTPQLDNHRPEVAAFKRGHRRGQSSLDIRLPSVSAPPDPRAVGTRTMEEKKEILGSMLGNVDALVEGVRKAGIWGLG